MTLDEYLLIRFIKSKSKEYEPENNHLHHWCKCWDRNTIPAEWDYKNNHLPEADWKYRHHPHLYN